MPGCVIAPALLSTPIDRLGDVRRVPFTAVLRSVFSKLEKQNRQKLSKYIAGNATIPCIIRSDLISLHKIVFFNLPSKEELDYIIHSLA